MEYAELEMRVVDSFVCIGKVLLSQSWKLHDSEHGCYNTTIWWVHYGFMEFSLLKGKIMIWH
jgi:hypothetical protein